MQLLIRNVTIKDIKECVYDLKFVHTHTYMYLQSSVRSLYIFTNNNNLHHLCIFTYK